VRRSTRVRGQLSIPAAQKPAIRSSTAKLSIRFYDEEGVDAGGVTREWFPDPSTTDVRPKQCALPALRSR